MKYVTIINNRQFEIEILPDGSVLLDGVPHEIDFLSLEDSQYSIIKDTQSMEVTIDETENGYEILLDGRLYEGKVLDERALLIGQRRGKGFITSGEVRSPMPGLIIEIPAQEGQRIAQGETVIILEAMKMQNELKSPIDGIVEQIHVKKGQTVDKNAVLINIKNEF